MPREWIGQGSRDRRLARSLLRIAMRDALLPSWARLRRPGALIGGPLRWLLPALAGDGAARAGAAAQVWLSHAAAMAGRVAGPKTLLSASLRAYIAALIHQQRLACVRGAHGTPAETPGWDVFAPGNAGSHPIETDRGKRFRWSEPAAMLPGWMPAGQHRILIGCLPVRSVIDAQPRLFLDGRPVSMQDVVVSSRSIELRVETSRPRLATLAWTCGSFAAPGAGCAFRSSASSVQDGPCQRSDVPLRSASRASRFSEARRNRTTSSGAGTKTLVSTLGVRRGTSRP